MRGSVLYQMGCQIRVRTCKALHKIQNDPYQSPCITAFFSSFEESIDKTLPKPKCTMNCIVADITLHIERVANFVNFRTITPLFKQRESVNMNERGI